MCLPFSKTLHNTALTPESTYIVNSENIICFSTKLPGNCEVIKITYAQLTFTFNIIISLFSVKT